MSAADVLAEAADYIEEHGWTRHGYHRHGRVCAIGAIRAVLTGEPWTYSPQELEPITWLDRFVRPRHGVPLVPWNDDYAKSRQEVVATMRACAESLRESA